MMYNAARMVCFGILCSASFAYVVADVPEKDIPVKTEAQLQMEKEAKAAEQVKAKQDLQVEQLNLPEDDTPRFDVKELRINGNSLISTQELLKDLPLIYNASDEPLDQAQTDDLYDLRIIHELISNPGRTHRVSTRTMNGLTEYIVSVYQRHGYAGIYVYIPAHAVEPGDKPRLKEDVLVVEVLEARVSDINVAYKTYDPQLLGEILYRDLEEGEKPILNESVIADWSPVKQGQVVNQRELDDFINLLNLNPDRYVSAIISRGTTSDSLGLRYDIYERNPWHFYVQADNSGSKERRWSPRLGVINTNLTGRDDRIIAIYQGPLDSHPAEPFIKNYSVYASYDFPVFTPRLRLNLYAGHSNFDLYTDDAGGINFLGSGDYHGGILRFNVFQTAGWFFDVTGSLSHEESRISPSLGIKSDIEMDLWAVGVDIHRSDDMSTTSLGFNRVESFDGSSKDEFNDSRTNSDPDFTIYTASAAHNRYLDIDKIQRVSGTFRMLTSNERLAQAKMTVFGGLYSVRGYRENEIVADGGILASAQYEYDLVKHFESEQKAGETEPEGMKAEKPWLTKLALLTFTDYGRAKTKDPIATDKRIQELNSVGLGIAATIGGHFDAGIYYGYPLRSTTDTDVGDGRWNFNLIYRF
jgi:hemolysin activation/secretion protein